MDTDTIRFIMSAVIKRHDRRQFTVFGYSSTDVADDIKEAFDTLRVTDELSDQQFAELVRSDDIDILVEMTGFSPYHRFGAMALRCAPIQISYLNHLGTSGVQNVDFILADEVSVLPDEDRFFTERVWRLPGSFLCYNYDMVEWPPVSPTPSRTNGFVTFGCFGSGGKINDDIIAIWARILTRVPSSRLYLRNHELTPRDNQQFMRDRFRRHGIAADRIRLDGGTTHDGLVRSYDHMDISLDTWPYCGGNTVAESLWQGVPVVTLKGDRFVSRYGASLLLAAGCGELVGHTADEYVEIAARLAQSPERLDRYRTNLRSMARKFGLSDAGRFARKLDDAYVSMMQAHRSSRPLAMRA
jgi:predicted O-linked N-acetylglucosamine transferase (SPINDLY family)